MFRRGESPLQGLWKGATPFGSIILCRGGEKKMSLKEEIQEHQERNNKAWKEAHGRARKCRCGRALHWDEEECSHCREERIKL